MPPSTRIPAQPRPTARRALAAVAGLGVALVAFAGPAAAQSTATPDPVAEAVARVAEVRALADALAGEYFQAVGQLATVQARVDEIEAKIPALTAEADRLRDLTRDRAVAAYKRSGSDLGAVIGADDLLAAARRTQWLDRLNQRDNVVADNLRAATARLADQRATLRVARETAAATLDRVKEQGAAIDALLVTAETQRRDAITAATPTTVPAAAAGGTGPSSSGATATTTTTSPKATPPVAPPNYVPTGGVHPRHDEPFLVCTRTRESSGNYKAFNSAGPYLGAYQFLQATWNSAASHAGRPDLIGVPANTASPYDQDDVAWSLFQWQGSRPWGGLCDD